MVGAADGLSLAKRSTLILRRDLVPLMAGAGANLTMISSGRETAVDSKRPYHGGQNLDWGMNR